ncbi:hypothetical protein GTY54_22385 [Streptomyces sp. SID625]|nr:hypothetical protein [Streptomyces sp. SID625]
MKPSFEQVWQILQADVVSDAELAKRLGCKPDLVRRARASLGMEPMPLPPSNARMPHEERLMLFSEQRPGGHRRWLGSVSGSGLPVIGSASVARIAFRAEYGREPAGRVQPGCGRRWCVAGPHQTDQSMRDAGGKTLPQGGRPVDLEARARIAEAFKDGPVPNLVVAAQLGVDRRIVAEVRARLHVPRSVRSSSQPKEWTRERFEALTARLPGGHRRWRGRTTADGVPLVGRTETAYRVAFTLHHGHQPDGPVRHTVDCAVKHCVEGSHLNDRRMREDVRALDRAGGVR